MNVEQMLRSIEIDWPATPAMDPHPARAHVRARRPVWRIAAIAIAALLLCAAAAMAVPGVRDPVLDWLGLRSVHVERVPRPLPEARGSKLALGRRTTLARARSRLGFVPVLPAGLGSPVAYYEDFPPGGQLALVYPRVLLTEVEGSLERQYLEKFLAPGTGAHALRVDGGRALWIDGLHQYAYADRGGAIRTDSVRTAGKVLLWRRGPLLLRLEGARTRAEALRIASSLRAAP